MNYQLIYDSIIQKARSEQRVKGCNIYFESHHIVPVCLGGLDKKLNKVLLTAREHFICHKLLVEIYPGNCSVFYGFWCMSLMKSGGREIHVSSKEFKRLKFIQANFNSVLKKGKKQSFDVIENRRIKLIGKKRDKEFCINLSKKRKGGGNPAFGKKQWNSGIKYDEVRVQPFIESWKNRQKVVCNVCGKEGHKNGMTRYHFENCKLLLHEHLSQSSN